MFELAAELLTAQTTCSGRVAALAANTVRWTPRLTEPGRYFVYYRLPDGLANRAPDAAYVLAGAGGTQTVKVDQRQAARGDWVSLGSLTFAADTAAYVELSDKATGAYLIADAIKFVRTDHVYTVRTDIRRQTILGLGVEIQSDSIGSGNVGLPGQGLRRSARPDGI